MLIEFKVKNFYSFQDEQVFSLVANSQKQHQNNTFTINKANLPTKQSPYTQAINLAERLQKLANEKY